MVHRYNELGVLERAAIVELSGDAGRAKTVITDPGLETGGICTPLSHVPGVDAVHRSFCQATT